jgi:putative ABC transport system permease protein
VIIDDLAVRRLSKNPKDPKTHIKVGDIFEINDMEARVVGICEAMTSFTGGPYVWTTYERALQYTPPSRKMLSAVIAAPKPGLSEEQVVEDIRRTTGLKAFVNKGFNESPHDFGTSTMLWYARNTGIPVSFGTTVIIGFIVGIAMSCQTFYAFVLENIRHLGALKAMGASNGKLCLMLVTQAFTVGIIGFGCGLLLTSMFGIVAINNEEPPFYMSWHIPVVALGVILFICTLAALLGIWRVSRFEPAMVFRA